MPFTLEQLEAAGLLEKQKSRRANPNRRAIIERRNAKSDRRLSGLNMNYNGPYRRETVDRRKKNKDRRGE